MKPELSIQKESTRCATGSCLQCRHCSEVNYEEIRSVKPEQKATSDLYAAEAQHYYFYFPPANDRVLR